MTLGFGVRSLTRFPSNPWIIRVPLFVIFNFNMESSKQEREKGTTGVPS